jgi:Ca-activated chloride channel family protein
LAFPRGADVRAAAARPGPWTRLASLPAALRISALALCGVALARPQTWRDAGSIELAGIDIMLVLDLSTSMEETDLVPDRLAAAKRVIADFIRRRRNDRIGLVVFGREAFTYCPLTTDYSTLLTLLSGVDHGLVDGRGTAIGNALGAALARLRRSEATSKVVVLLTDGDSNAGNLAPLEAARMAQSLGVRVFTVLVGDNEPQSPIGGLFRLRRRHPVNPRLLEQIAGGTGGTPYVASDTGALEERFHRILEELDRSKIEDVGAVHGEAFGRLAWPALLLLLGDVALSLTRLRRLP